MSLVMAEKQVLKLDLACGQNVRDGFTGVDKYTGENRVDVLKFPWPWADNSVDEIHCSHFIEHIPMVEVEHQGRVKDLLFAFFDEAYRVLKPGALMTVICPCARSNRAFQDPTHRRFIVMETFAYLNRGWREFNKLDHYQVQCNFDFDVRPGTAPEEALRPTEVQMQRHNSMWNVVLDLMAVLKKA